MHSKGTKGIQKAQILQGQQLLYMYRILYLPLVSFSPISRYIWQIRTRSNSADAF